MTENTKSCIEAISRIEESLRKDAAHLIATSGSFNQKQVAILLNSSEKLRQIAHELRVAILEETQGSSTADQPFDPERFPLCFINDKHLYKVGLSENKKPDGTPRTWWKKAQIQEVEKILDAITALYGDDFRRSDLKNAVGVPDYKVDIVITALKSTGYIEASKKNGFYRIKKGTKQDWMHSLELLPVETRLLTNDTQ